MLFHRGSLVLCSLLIFAVMERSPASEPVAGSSVGETSLRVSYNRDIRPILSNKCFTCHGPDAKQRQAGLRLDSREEALRPTESGTVVIVPNKPEESELVRRVLSSDEDRMPPPETDKRLTAAEKELLRRWVLEGAQWEQHWSLIPPARPELPQVSNPGWPRGAIDRFVLARLDRAGLRPSAEADRSTLIRRLTLDLTGLPPTPAEVDAFVADQSADAYGRLVDRLLSSSHYGERMALEWLDAARYADTHGYHIDSGRDMWRWRDWVIEAFNRNLPFDRFTIEQLAGDLLPDPTLEQRIASGFNRNHMINYEGGAIPEEYQVAYIVDRVNTTGTVWLGLTVGCAQCHDHKYDPITQKEYYALYAFFHNVPELGLDGKQGNAVPMIPAPTRKQAEELARLEAAIREHEHQPQSDELAKLRQAHAELLKQAPTTMVMQEMETPRETFMLVRGQYDKLGEKVAPGVPAGLPPLPSGAAANRLGLAQWLVDPRHPLTARVIVNRYWQMYFGVGLVPTSEDFGSQGQWPSNPELLDWLATEFIASGWNVKHVQRLIVTSATYRQSSAATAELLAQDPENRLLARGTRVRLPAELIRDQALAASGLLDDRIGGPSVSPYQPIGLWEELMGREDGAKFTAQVYRQSHGADLYRRTMYTFWKRTCPPPTLSTFDAPDRETCTVRRARTNTPLQALVLMNDPTYVEAARKLAERMLTEAGSSDEERITLAFRLVTGRRPRAAELAVLREIHTAQLAAYRDDPLAALKLLTVGESPRDERLEMAELAAWTMVASVILNLDETLTKG